MNKKSALNSLDQSKFAKLKYTRAIFYSNSEYTQPVFWPY